MKELIGYGNKYIEKMNVGDVALLKTCVFSLGLIAGACVPRRHKKKAIFISSVAFAFTYAPLMTKFLQVVLYESRKEIDAAENEG